MEIGSQSTGSDPGADFRPVLAANSAIFSDELDIFCVSWNSISGGGGEKDGGGRLCTEFGPNWQKETDPPRADIRTLRSVYTVYTKCSEM